MSRVPGQAISRQAPALRTKGSPSDGRTECGAFLILPNRLWVVDQFEQWWYKAKGRGWDCLLYTSDAADDM
eukprot:5279374-Lingulodinium_polyedra.AAC.1